MRSLAPIAVALLVALASPSVADTIIVDHGGGGDYEYIQGGINAASEGDTVLVREGTYTGENNVNLDFGGTNIVLEGETGATWPTIDCGGADNTRALYFHSGEDTTSIVRDFMIMNGSAINGGGVYCADGSSPLFQSCTFQGHYALRGGAVYALGADPIFRSCDFIGNVAGTGGGGGAVCAQNSAARFRFCYFEDNDCEIGGVGGGVCTWDSPAGRQAPFIQYSSFVGCGVENFGGAIYCKNVSPDIVRCQFWDNSAPFGGGAICCDGASPNITNCTIVRSSSMANGSGVYCGQVFGSSGSSPTITNTIVAFGLGAGVKGIACGGPGDSPTITHCVVFGNEGGDDVCGDHHDNIVYDPLFCDADGDDFTLCEDSKCLPENNPWDELVGVLSSGCGPCDDPVEDASWGSIKAMYR